MTPRSRRRRSIFLAPLVCVVLAGAAACLAPGADVPYVQTPTDVVTEMLKLAGVKANDVVYDLGSGDGRIVIAAARDFGARGVGIEIDPGLVAYSTELARKAGVGDRVTFRSDVTEVLAPAPVSNVEDLLEWMRNQEALHFHEVTRISELRPGARIVSHDFDMGDWLPSQTIRVAWRDRTSYVFLWVVPPRS